MKVTLGSSRPTDAVIVDWCAPPSGASVTPDGVPATTKREPEYDRVDERVQPAQHERVVDRADRQQRLAGQVPGQAELAEQQEQVHLADAQLDVLPGRALGPAQQRVLAPGPALRSGANTPVRLMKPARLVEVADVGRGGDEVGRDLGVAGQVDQDPAERLLGGDRLAGAQAGRRRAPATGRATAGAARGPGARGGPPAHCPAGVAGSSRSHSVGRGQAERARAARRSARWSAARSGCAGCRRSAAPSP